MKQGLSEPIVVVIGNIFFRQPHIIIICELINSIDLCKYISGYSADGINLTHKSSGALLLYHGSVIIQNSICFFKPAKKHNVGPSAQCGGHSLAPIIIFIISSPSFRQLCFWPKFPGLFHFVPICFICLRCPILVHSMTRL